jgi:two-component system, OmpR family, sensor histidine kinase MprB
MSLRHRMVVLSAAAVALAVVLSACACYVAVQSSMRGRLDRQLKTFAATAAAVARNAPAHSHPRKGAPFSPRLPRAGLETGGDAALFSATGKIDRSPEDHTVFLLTSHDLAVARGRAQAYFRNGKAGATDVRIYVMPAGSGRAVIAEQSLSDLQSTLRDLAVILTAIALAGVALAGLLGLLVARAAAVPVHLLRQAAEHVGSTGDLSRRIETIGDDDLGRLGVSFNTMLAALEESHRAQQQLIADASHELRTPVASLRTNLEVLLRNPELHAAEKTPLLSDLIEQSAELGALIEDLLESARSGDTSSAPEPVALDELIASEIEHYSAQHSHIYFDVQLQPHVVLGRERRLRRAVVNLLDNAVKWNPPDAIVEVSLSVGELTVRDHGPGFREEDLPRVFDRFYRSPAARGIPGSGLGLSIVRKVASEHGGAVSACNASDGGALIILTLPAYTADHANPHAELMAHA